LIVHGKSASNTQESRSNYLPQWRNVMKLSATSSTRLQHQQQHCQDWQLQHSSIAAVFALVEMDDFLLDEDDDDVDNEGLLQKTAAGTIEMTAGGYKS
jgi:hypothetical protein